MDLSFGFAPMRSVPRNTRISSDISSPGMTLITTTSRHDSTARSEPTAMRRTSAIAHRFPPMPCSESTRPLRSG